MEHDDSAEPQSVLAATRKQLAIRATIAIVLLGTVIASRLWWTHQQTPKNWGVVVPGQIYRSGQISRHAIAQVLRDHGIKRVIFLSEDKADRPDVQAEERACRELGIERINLPLDGDGRGDIEMYARAIELIAQSQQRGEPVLVHCHAGAQRTGGVIAMYRTLIERKTSGQALAELFAYGHDPEKNPALLPYLNENVRTLSNTLLARHVLPAIRNDLPHFELAMHTK